jgi:signal transduction histidine kinase/ligand-binding sensor domain-containing protein
VSERSRHGGHTSALHRSRSFLEHLLLLCFIASASCSVARALNPHKALNDYSRQLWNTDSGLPQNSVHAILQTTDGFLWLGTEGGLARFDGYRFRVFDRQSNPRLPGDDIRCLFEDSSGALWVGTASGLARLKDGETRSYSAAEGVPAGAVHIILQTRDGRLWVLTDGGLATATLASASPAEIHFHTLSQNDGMTSGGLLSITADARGGLWIGTTQGLEHIAGIQVEHGPATLTGKSIDALATAPANASTLFIASAAGLMKLTDGTLTTLAKSAALPPGGTRSLLVTNDGVWAVGRSSAILVRRTETTAFTTGGALPGTQITAIARDRNGAVWIGTNAGIARFWNGKIETVARGSDADAAAVLSLYQDREGDLWIGTETAGVKVLRDRMFQLLPGTPDAMESPITSVLQSADAALWVGTNGAGVTRIAPNGTHTYTTKDGLTSDTILALGTGAAQPADVWIGTPDGLNVPSMSEAGRWKALTSADGLADDLVRSILLAHDGAVWIGSRRGVTRWKNNQSTIFTTAQGLGSDLVGPMLQTQSGDLWIGTSGGLTRLHDGALKNYTTADGLPGNIITSLQASRDGGFWVGTAQHGLAYWDGSHFFSFARAASIPRQIYGLLEDSSGSLWLTSDRGVFRIPLADLDNFRVASTTDVAVVPYGTADGLPTVETEGVGYPSAWRLNDGRITFATRRGVVVANPSQSPASESAPPVVLEDITIDGRNATRPEIASMPPGPSHFSFSFAGINLAAPQRVQYRYMLQGFDRSWIDAGTRRVAYYTSIPHGRYTFRISARNAGGPWSAPVDLAVDLHPHAYETGWFKVLLAVLLLLLAFGLYQLRVRTLQSKFAAVSAERSRLAREIHDTLAQSFVAVSVRLELMAQMLRSSDGVESCREQLNQTRSLVRDSLAEARRSIWDLRSEGVGARSLPARLATLVQETKPKIPDTQFETTGTYRTLPQPMEDEVFRIAQESVTNAVRHASARSLRLQLSYQLDSLSLRIVDDGCGFAVEQAPSRAEGHYGLTGIQERARILDADASIESKPGKGTTVEVRVPLARESRAKREHV